MCVSSSIETFGASPANIQWVVVRGDSAVLRVDFKEADEETYLDTTGWTYKATAYDPQSDFLDDITVEESPGYVDLKIPASLSANWGTRYISVVAELPFDLQVKMPQNTETLTWTPIIGTIKVLGDVTPGGSL